jgi:proteasome lid subunit RPN8/RPN11
MRVESLEGRLVMLKISEAALAELVSHAQTDAPIEACGYLGEKDGAADLVLRLTNVDASPEHFSLDPREQFAAVRQMRPSGYRLRAVYHSHPASPARPSEEDVRLAFDPSLSYVIVSLAGTSPVVKSFTIRQSVVTPEEIEAVSLLKEQH